MIHRGVQLNCSALQPGSKTSKIAALPAMRGEEAARWSRATNKTMSPRLTRFRKPSHVSTTPLALILVMLPLSAWALDDGRFTLFAQETFAWDNNVLRISSNVSPGTSDSPRNDTYHATIVGGAFDLPVSRQRFTGRISWNDTRFDRYGQLDYRGHDGNLMWLWEIGSEASGKLGYSDMAAPQTFAGVSGRSSNIVRTKQEFVNGQFYVTPRWRLNGGAAGLQQSNSDVLFQFDDIDIATGEVSLNYVTPAKNVFGIRARIEDGHYPNREFVIGGALPHSYRQYESGVVFDWTVTDKSKLAGHTHYANRRWDRFGQIDWSGFLGRVQYDWNPTGKLTVNMIVRREIDPYDDMRGQFTLVNGLLVTSRWNAMAKLDLSAILDYSHRDYLGASQFACGLIAGSSDRIKSGVINVAWRPFDVVTFSFSAQHQNCSSDILGGNYSATIYALGVKVSL